MDILSIVGLVLALNAILVGAVLKGAGIMALVSAAAFMIVVVGTIAAIFIQTPLNVMRRALCAPRAGPTAPRDRECDARPRPSC